MTDNRKDVDMRLALEAILAEREYQRERWGVDHDHRHTPEEWVTIMNIWLGKAAQETAAYRDSGTNLPSFKKRLSQIGAIALAAVEALGQEE